MVDQVIPPGVLVDRSAEETLDRLVGDWWVWQLKRGHRFSSDDFLTAWAASGVRPQGQKILDLGCGIGSVGLMTLWKLGAEANLRCVEVQELSHGLACRSVTHNGLTDRVEVVLGDIRDHAVVPETHGFDLVTGSPPYLPVGAGVLSSHPQRAAARMELHGSVFDYCEAAGRSLSPDGRFVFCHLAQDERPEAAVKRAGLRLLGRRDVLFGEGQAPMISLFECGWRGEFGIREPLQIRDSDGQWTAQYVQVRRDMGFLESSTEESLLRPRAEGLP